MLKKQLYREKYNGVKYCRVAKKNQPCFNRKCRFVHDLRVKIPCPYGGKCNFGHDCLYVHAEDEQWKIERLKEELQSFIGLILGYEFAKLNQTCLKELGGSVRRKDEMNVNVQEFKLGLDDDEQLNDDEDGISETEDIFEMPSFDNEVEIVVMEKTLSQKTEIVPGKNEDEEMASTQEKRKCFCGGKNCPVCRKGERDSFDVEEEEDEDEDEDADEDEDLEQYYSKVEKRLDFDGMSESSDECIPNMPLRHGCCGCTQSGCVACEREGFCGLYYCSRCMPSHFNTPFQRGRGRVWSGRRGGAGWNSGRSREYGIRGRGRPPGRSIPYSPPKW